MRFSDAFRIFAVILAFSLGLSGAAIAEGEASEEEGKPPVESAPPDDQAGDEEEPSEEGTEEDAEQE
jgi:hypothetical protein